jgi:hypothetical protein
VESAIFFGFHIGSLKAVIGRAATVDARFEFSRLFDQDSREFRICG